MVQIYIKTKLYFPLFGYTKKKNISKRRDISWFKRSYAAVSLNITSGNYTWKKEKLSLKTCYVNSCQKWRKSDELASIGVSVVVVNALFWCVRHHCFFQLNFAQWRSHEASLLLWSSTTNDNSVPAGILARHSITSNF